MGTPKLSNLDWDFPLSIINQPFWGSPHFRNPPYYNSIYTDVHCINKSIVPWHAICWAGVGGTHIRRVYIYIYTYTCMYVCIYIYGPVSRLPTPHAYVRTYIRTCIHAYMHTYIHAYMHTFIHAYIHTHMHTYINYIHKLHT